MSVTIDTTTCRLSNFEAGVLAELARLQCREVELVAHIEQLNGQLEAAATAAEEQGVQLADRDAAIERMKAREQTHRARLAAAAEERDALLLRLGEAPPLPVPDDDATPDDAE